MKCMICVCLFVPHSSHKTKRDIQTCLGCTRVRSIDRDGERRDTGRRKMKGKRIKVQGTLIFSRQISSIEWPMMKWKVDELIQRR